MRFSSNLKTLPVRTRFLRGQFLSGLQKTLKLMLNTKKNCVKPWTKAITVETALGIFKGKILGTIFGPLQYNE